MATKINIRKKSQTVEKPVPIGITVVYSDKNGNHDEFFSNDWLNSYRKDSSSDKQVIQQVYKNFNNTLRPKESKRIICKMYHTYEAKTYVVMK